MKLLLMLFILFSNGNDTLKLDYCYEQIYAKYPLGAQRELNKSSTNLKLKNLNINYLPQIKITGQASYQSDVTKVDIGSPLFTSPKINKDQYKIYLDIKQTVFDGGVTSSLKDVERYQLQANIQKIEVELYQLKQRVNDLFFSILLLQEGKDLIQLKLNTVKKQLSEIESQIKYGILPISSRYILEAEILKIDQELSEIESNRIASLNMLGELLNDEFKENTVLELPSPIVTDFEINLGKRPEYKMFLLEKNALKSYDEVIISRIIPKLSIFGQGGYGRPGLNFLDNVFQPYYIVGLNLSWNPINWNRNKNEIQINLINQKIVDIRKATFDKNLKVSLKKYKTIISKLEKLIEKDVEIIELKSKILISISSQLKNGIITTTDYLTELNSENQAKIMLQTHRVQLVQAKIDFLTLKGY